MAEPHVRGWVHERFDAVRKAFLDNFRERGEVGAGLVVRHQGRVVVDLHGGLADPDTSRHWEPDTPVVTFSATKGLVAIACLVLVERGQLALDEPVATYWPAFAAHGKAHVTVRQLLNHRAGLPVIDEPLTLEDFADPDRVATALEAQVPRWSPGTVQAYGAIAWGAYVSALFRKVTGQSVGTWFREHLAGPLSLDAWIGSPPEVAARAARLLPLTRAERLRHRLPALLVRGPAEGRIFRRFLLGKRTLVGQALLNPAMGPRRFEALNDPAVLALELPWMGGVCTAEALSRAYAAVIGEVDGSRLVGPTAVERLAVRQSWSERDRVLHKAVGFSQGFVKEASGLFSPHAAAFGHPGAGGALGWADPDTGLAIGYVMNRMDWRIRSPRAIALTRAAYASL
ncbi:MAG: serine hydrolase domain-containing protein [Myxococcota bacterium]